MDISTVSMALSASLNPAPVTPVELQPADERATAQFASMMAAPVPAAELAPVTLTDTSVLVVPVQPPTMGDQILNGLQTVSSELKQSISDVSAALKPGVDVSVSELLRVQMGLMQVSVTYELVGKGISKSTQNLDQLVKLQ